jgi:hypothetical protein
MFTRLPSRACCSRSPTTTGKPLFDEAMAAARAPNLDELLPLWTHAARAMLQRRDGGDSVSLARTLVAALPEQRDTLLAAWAAVLTDAQRTHL